MEKEMYGQLSYKNEFFEVSQRNYLDDYGYLESKKIDMTLSGKYLYKYPFKKISKYRLDEYPKTSEKNILIDNIKKKYNFYDINYSVILGPGSNGLIQNICKILLKKGENLLIPYLSFSQAEFAANSYGIETRRVYLDDYNISLEYFEKSIDNKTKMIYICNPNNPTGQIIENEKILDFAKKYPNIYFVIDESNIEFSTKKSLIEGTIVPNLIVIKSFSKAYGLANLRIGYLVCSTNIADIYIKEITINEFSGISAYYANKVICSNMYKKNVKKIIKEIAYLRNGLEKTGICTLETNTNTIFTKTIFKEEMIKEFKNHNISLIPIIDQNGDIHFRIACQTHNINKKFIYELSKIDNIKKYIIE